MLTHSLLQAAVDESRIGGYLRWRGPEKIYIRDWGKNDSSVNATSWKEKVEKSMALTEVKKWPQFEEKKSKELISCSRVRNNCSVNCVTTIFLRYQTCISDFGVLTLNQKVKSSEQIRYMVNITKTLRPKAQSNRDYFQKSSSWDSLKLK